MHYFILQLDKKVTPEDCFELLDDFISGIIDFFIKSDRPPLEYLILPKTDLLNNLYSQMRTVQTNDHVFWSYRKKPLIFLNFKLKFFAAK